MNLIKLRDLIKNSRQFFQTSINLLIYYFQAKNILMLRFLGAITTIFFFSRDFGQRLKEGVLYTAARNGILIAVGLILIV